MQVAGHQYGSDNDNDNDDNDGLVEEQPVHLRRTSVDDDYESDQPVNVKAHDVRLDPFEESETDGINPGDFSDDADLDNIEEHPARAKNIVEEMVCTSLLRQ